MTELRADPPTTDELDDWDDEDRDCYWCHGEGWDECSHPLECTKQHSRDGLCRCDSCGGSGLAKDMTIW